MTPNGCRRKSWSRPETTTRTPLSASDSAASTIGCVEELHLVDPDDVVAVRACDELGNAVDGNCAHAGSGVGDDVRRVVAVVDPRLEDDDVLAGDLGPAQSADHLLALAREHRPADHLEPAAALGGNANHGARGYTRVSAGRPFR